MTTSAATQLQRRVNVRRLKALVEQPSIVLLSASGGPNHSTIEALNATADLDGTLRPKLSGYTPVPGDSWPLIRARSVSGNFDTVDLGAIALPRGIVARVKNVRFQSMDGNGTEVQLNVEQKLILRANQKSGSLKLENANGGPIQFDAYSVTSPSGVLDPNMWSNLQNAGGPGWEEAQPTVNGLSELNPTNSSTLDAPETLLGTPYVAAAPTGFGDQPAGEDLTLTYRTTDDTTHEGIVDYGFNHNTLVLKVNPTTGAAVIWNRSEFDVSIDVYSIVSDSGSLEEEDGGWESFEDQLLGDWDEANPNAFAISELNPTGSTDIHSGSVFPIGKPFDETDGSRDLALEFRRSTDSTTFQGVVVYAITGDLDFDDITGFVAVISGGGGAQAVPEPSAFVRAGLAIIGLLGYGRGRRIPIRRLRF